MTDTENAGFADALFDFTAAFRAVPSEAPKPINPRDADPLTWIVGAQNLKGQEL